MLRFWSCLDTEGELSNPLVWIYNSRAAGSEFGKDLWNEPQQKLCIHSHKTSTRATKKDLNPHKLAKNSTVGFGHDFDKKDRASNNHYAIFSHSAFWYLHDILCTLGKLNT